MSALTPCRRERAVPAPEIARTPPAAPKVWMVAGAFAAVYVIWGSTYLGIRLAIETIPPFLMAGARFIVAGGVLYAIMRRRGAPRPQAIHWRDAFILGALLLLVGNGGVSWAEKRVPTNITALTVAGTPLWMLVLDWLRPGGRRPHGLVFAGLGLGFVGVVLIVASRDAQGHGVMDPAGAVMLLSASVCWAGGSIFSRHARQPTSALQAISMQMLAGGVLMLLASLLLGETRNWSLHDVSAQSAEAFVYLTVFGSLVGFTCYVWLLRVSTPARVSTYAYVNPLIAVVVGWIVLKEPLPAGALLAGAFILVAVILITVKGRAR
ncbi:MAG: EamA family transporter [Chthoniobacter sp.]|uniref:EamA family transporter n=1 Tax=Chthoniobacter sp. TaxID=2510640 RepID=UPI0032A93929